MQKTEVFTCNQCQETFEQESLAQEHEKKCLPLQVGQRVKFMFELPAFEGRITKLCPPSRLGAKPIVELECDVEVVEPDCLQDGKHVWVYRDYVLRILA